MFAADRYDYYPDVGGLSFPMQDVVAPGKEKTPGAGPGVLVKVGAGVDPSIEDVEVEFLDLAAGCRGLGALVHGGGLDRFSC